MNDGAGSVNFVGRPFPGPVPVRPSEVPPFASPVGAGLVPALDEAEINSATTPSVALSLRAPERCVAIPSPLYEIASGLAPLAMT